MLSSLKISLEGEGERLGLKTLFLTYPKDFPITISEEQKNLYINCKEVDATLLSFCQKRAEEGCFITIETERSIEKEFLDIPNLIVFLNLDEFVALDSLPNLFIKIRVTTEEGLEYKINLANLFAVGHYRNVLLMPEFICDYQKLLSGDNIEKISWGIRFMPPVQNIIRIP